LTRLDAARGPTGRSAIARIIAWLRQPSGLVVAAVFLVGLALTAKVPASSRFLLVLHDAAHAPFGAGLALVAFAGLGHWRGAPGGHARYLLAFALSMLLGGAVEIAQGFVGRGPSLYDLYTDGLGSACALAGLGAGSAWRSADAAARRRWPWAAVVALLAGALAAAPIVEAALAYARRAALFPVIAEFERRTDEFFLTLWSADATLEPLPAQWRRDGDPRLSLRLEALPGSWPGVAHDEPERDWRRHRTLLVDVTNPSAAPLPLTLRVHDLAHDLRAADRFNRDFVIPPSSRQLLRIPLGDIEAGPAGRRLDLGHVAGLVLFAPGAEAQPGRVFFVTRIWLE
jgi:hypothetical protein